MIAVGASHRTTSVVSLGALSRAARDFEHRVREIASSGVRSEDPGSRS